MRRRRRCFTLRRRLEVSQVLQKWTRRKKWKVRNCFSAQVRAACLPLEGGGGGALWCQQRAGGGPEIRRVGSVGSSWWSSTWGGGTVVALSPRAVREGGAGSPALHRQRPAREKLKSATNQPHPLRQRAVQVLAGFGGAINQD